MSNWKDCCEAVLDRYDEKNQDYPKKFICPDCNYIWRLSDTKQGPEYLCVAKHWELSHFDTIWMKRCPECGAVICSETESCPQCWFGSVVSEWETEWEEVEYRRVKKDGE